MASLVVMAWQDKMPYYWDTARQNVILPGQIGTQHSEARTNGHKICYNELSVPVSRRSQLKHAVMCKWQHLLVGTSDYGSKNFELMVMKHG